MKFLIIFFLSNSAWAQIQKTQVLFFGGVGFKNEHTEIFAQQLQTAAPIGLNYVFDAVAYPGDKQYYADAIKSGQSIIKKYTKEINSVPGKKFVLVGHSSGSAFAIEIAKKVKDPKQVSVIVLDGFYPQLELQKKTSVFCWGAYNASDLSIESTNYKLMKTCNQFREYPSNVCKTPACLHFALLDAKNTIVSYSQIDFNKIVPNLEWLSP